MLDLRRRWGLSARGLPVGSVVHGFDGEWRVSLDSDAKSPVDLCADPAVQRLQPAGSADQSRAERPSDDRHRGAATAGSLRLKATRPDLHPGRRRQAGSSLRLARTSERAYRSPAESSSNGWAFRRLACVLASLLFAMFRRGSVRPGASRTGVSDGRRPLLGQLIRPSVLAAVPPGRFSASSLTCSGEVRLGLWAICLVATYASVLFVQRTAFTAGVRRPFGELRRSLRAFAGARLDPRLRCVPGSRSIWKAWPGSIWPPCFCFPSPFFVVQRYERALTCASDDQTHHLLSTTSTPVSRDSTAGTFLFGGLTGESAWSRSAAGWPNFS